MSVDLIKYAFVSGVLTPTLFGRSDLEKYDLGLAEARNFFVDYRGGLSNRTGSEFGDFIQTPELGTKFVPFRYSPNVGDTFVVLFAANYIRLIQDNGYVLDSAKPIVAIDGASAVTVTGHGLTGLNMIRLLGAPGKEYLNMRSFLANATDANTLVLYDMHGILVPTSVGTYTGSGSLAKIFTLTSPYAPEDLQVLHARQNRNSIMLTHPEYPPYELTRAADGTWSLSEFEIGNDRASPFNYIGTPSAVGTAGVGFAVTSVGFDGEESRVGIPFLNEATVNYTTTSGSFLLQWSPIENTQYYNVYRTNVLPVGTDITTGSQLGYLGRTNGTSFTDNNIIPNFAISAPAQYDPFANAGVAYVNIVAEGSGYLKNSVVTISGGGGSGFEGYPIVAADGKVMNIVVTNAGSGYVSPTISITDGTGFEGNIVLTPATGNYPAESAVFQQRQVFASTYNRPLTIWASRPGRRHNFDVSRVVVDNDSYEFDIEVDQVSPISHLIPMRGGLLIMAQAGIWQLTGQGGGAVTPSNALSDPQSYGGVSDLPPLKVDTDLLYVEGKGSTVRMLAYNDLSKVYGGTDVSILSNHFFGKGRDILAWGFAQEPFKIVHAVRADGKLLTFTTVKEQNVYAWTENATRGFYRDVCVIQEGNEDVAYYAIDRDFPQGRVRFFERSATRTFSNVEDGMFVDCALRLASSPQMAATLYPTAATGTAVAFNTNADVFVSGHVGFIIRVGGGKAVVTSYVNPRQVICNILRPITDLYPENPVSFPSPAAPGTWTLDYTVAFVSGLWHLEGTQVRVLGDGVDMGLMTVTNGAVGLTTPCSRVIVGIPYTSVARTLPMTAPGMSVIEARRKRVVGLAFRANETQGLKWGNRLDNLYIPKYLSEGDYGDPVELYNGLAHLGIEPEWNDDGQIYFVQDAPLPATVLGFVLKTEVGDDPD